MRERAEITSGGARRVLALMVAGGGDPGAIAEREGLAGTSGADELDAIVERAIEANPDAAEKVREGKGRAIGPIVGAAMREARGRADGGEVTRLIRSKLGVG
jgi:aspartyl-tRNA(Asn)/glutamyl-tRNA(Gln) amidotransferase subunit B